MNLRGLFRNLLVLFLVSVIFSPAAAQVSPKVKSILEKQSFPDLIKQYKQEAVILKSPGNTARRIAARPYTIGEGYRVQAFAGSSRENAYSVAADLRALNIDSVYVIETPERLYKVQIGNYQDRREAEQPLERVKQGGRSGAWIVQSEIHVPKEVAQASPAAITASAQPAVDNASPAIYYTIQIFATNDMAKAEEIRSAFQREYNLPVEIQHQNTIYKVLVGKFDDRPAAEQQLLVLRRKRFDDAWITQKMSS